MTASETEKAFGRELKAAEPEMTTNSSHGTIAEDSEGPLEFDKAPDGGLRAWLVAAGGFCIIFCCLGITMSFGIFQQYYSTHQLRGESPDRIAWIGSVAGFIQFAAGAVSGPLFDRYGMRIVYPASAAYVFSLMMLSLCTQYYQFILVQGVLIGVTTSMIQLPAFAAPSQYFDKYRGAALGIVISGSSLGGVVYPISFSTMLNGSSLGFGWSARIMGFAAIPLVVFACLTMRPRLPPRQSQFLILSAFKDLRYICLIGAIFFMMLGMNTPLYFIPTYAVSKGVDPKLASYLVAIINGSSTFGRIIPGILADRLGRFNVFAAGGICTGIVTLCLYRVETTAALTAYSVFFGFASGTIISGGSTALTVCADSPQNIGTYMGMGMSVASISVLIGPPINGILIERYSGFFELSVFSGVMCLAGGCIAILSKKFGPGGILGRS